ncbi:MAG: metalloprotease [Flavobacteriaceae bacterium]|nr:MAG: metalloprotease [Flavobacteriaceae bacterium]
MRWKNRESSGNVEDQRGSGSYSSGGIGIIGTVLIVVISLIMGENPLAVLSQFQNFSTPTESSYPSSDPQSDALAQFSSVVLKDTEDVWSSLFINQLGGQYNKPSMVIFSGQTSTGCGYASASTGPFYCPADEKIYLDLGFYNELKERFGGGGDFAMAYVISHEVAHHVQKQLGITDKIDALRGRISQEQENQYSVRLELQADYLAGVWAHEIQKTKNVLEEGDIEEALNAATAIGDDRIQEQSQGYVVPDAFTHGTSEQRVRWFTKGYQSGDLQGADTFNIPYAQL